MEKPFLRSGGVAGAETCQLVGTGPSAQLELEGLVHELRHVSFGRKVEGSSRGLKVYNCWYERVEAQLLDHSVRVGPTHC